MGAGPGTQIAGHVDLGGATRTISISGFSAELYDGVISAPISGTGGLTYSGLTANGQCFFAGAPFRAGAWATSGHTSIVGGTRSLPAA